MRQLKYDVNFNNIVDDIHVWNNNAIPEKVLDFVEKSLDSKIIYDEESDMCYCSKCFTELTKKYYCKKCHKKLGDSEYDASRVINVYDLEKEKYNESDFYYYVFDINEDKLLLYEIKGTIKLYIRRFSPSKQHLISVNKVLLVDKEGITDLLTYNRYSFQNFKKEITEVEQDDCLWELNDHYEASDAFDYFTSNNGFLYTDNLTKLKKTIYKYTYIWDSIKYLKNNDISLWKITYLPLANPSFEYLIKYKLYTLAYDSDKIEFKKSFKETFGVDKKYLPFMVENDFNYDELKMFSYTKIEDVYLLKRLAIFIHEFVNVKNNYGIGIDKIVNYFLKEHIRSLGGIYEYSDYLKLCKELGFNFKDKKVIFPKDLMKEHDKLYLQYEMIVKPMVCENIIKIGKILEINKYEDDNYVIYPAPSIDSLIEESSNQNNCVKTYAEKYSKGESFIFFMRDKSDLNKSLVTIEIKNNKVVQARAKNNEEVDSSLMNIIKNWEKKLVPIEFEISTN